MRTPSVCAALLLLSAAAPAWAQSSAEDRAAADKLFADGVALAAAGDHAAACPKFETSQKLDPAIGALLNLGDCYEHLGRYASAWTSYNACADMAALKNDARAADARKRARNVETRLSMLVVRIAPEADVAGLVLTRDGKALDRSLWGVAMPVDPGEHAVEAAAPGHAPWRSKVAIDKPGPSEIRVPKLEQQATSSGPKEVAVAPRAVAASAPTAFWSVQRILDQLASRAATIIPRIPPRIGLAAALTRVDDLS